MHIYIHIPTHVHLSSCISIQRPRFQALYSYAPADADEVSLQVGDVILEPQSIDQGWMFGLNQRTGQRGMLPANYVKLI